MIKRVLPAIWSGIAALHIYWALITPVGIYNDDAICLLLARALRRGVYALPDGLNLPATYPPPLFPLIIAPLTWALEPKWEAMRIVGLASSALLVFMSWRLARRILSEAWAIAAALLVSLNNVLMVYSGVVMPDIAYAAFSLAIFTAFSKENRGPRRLMVLATAAGLTALLRPHGVILIGSLCLAFWTRREFLRGILFLIISMFLPGMWMARNFAVAGTSSGYGSYWATMWSQWNVHAQFAHSVRVMAIYFGQGLLGLVDLASQPQLLIAAAAVAVVLTAYGVRRALKAHHDLGITAMAIYLSLMVIVQMAWSIEVVRYLIPILPLCWIFMLKAGTELSGRRQWLAACFLLLAAAAAVRPDIFLLKGERPAAIWRPATMAWINRNVPESSRLMAPREGAVMLLSGRRALPMTSGMTVNQWLAEIRSYHVEYLFLESSQMMRKMAWLTQSQGANEVYRNLDEDTFVLRLGPPAPTGH